MKKIVIIDYGLGNLRSVRKGLEYVGAMPIISSRDTDIQDADGLILPGVGAFSDAMKNIELLKEAIGRYVETEKPMLGICLGQQIIMSESEEGRLTKGLDIIPGRVIRFGGQGLKVPHMGWNSIKITQKHPLFEGIEDDTYLYFVHSYYVQTDAEHTLAMCDYGVDFAAAVINRKGNVMGTQFHPEKSGKTGLKILNNFVNMC